MDVFDFAGNFQHQIDPKGRVTIPAAYRDGLAGGFTIGMNSTFDAIALYPTEKWRQIGEQLDRIPDSDARGMRYVRQIKAFSFIHQQLDGQGRVLLPSVLREKAGMERSIRFVGVGHYLELWDEARFGQMCTSVEEDMDDLLEYINDRYAPNGRPDRGGAL